MLNTKLPFKQHYLLKRTNASLLYYAYYIHKNCLLKKPDQNPLGSFKDLSTHRDRQWEATLFYSI
jgi:hypothetical protein